ncbi:Uma2 family endonuclease [Tychonema sp. LEGE 07203]|uniref:Uma2 family endonuclease n=1 Tax=Tychonema sp. LEGE 07203 TaxID=1828671 RepID=UPI00187FE832|nr:Uma2 family endonuclease [Tychonema sp. LEGE 07203]MBE9093774.1 Uma2 family endonuclease [Tychonema sp. LEGE 07203]
MVAATVAQKHFTLEEFTANPLDQIEWVDGKLVEKDGVTVKHGKIQSRLGCAWANYRTLSKNGGELYISPPCRTSRQIRRPDVAYLTPELVAQYGNLATLPQSFPLIAEIVSPADIAEDVFLKAQEYLASSCQEVWLVFPESRLIFVITQDRMLTFRAGDTATTQQILSGFSIEVDRLLA